MLKKLTALLVPVIHSTDAETVYRILPAPIS